MWDLLDLNRELQNYYTHEKNLHSDAQWPWYCIIHVLHINSERTIILPLQYCNIAIVYSMLHRINSYWGLVKNDIAGTLESLSTRLKNESWLNTTKHTGRVFPVCTNVCLCAWIKRDFWWPGWITCVSVV